MTGPLLLLLPTTRRDVRRGFDRHQPFPQADHGPAGLPQSIAGQGTGRTRHHELFGAGPAGPSALSQTAARVTISGVQAR